MKSAAIQVTTIPSLQQRIQALKLRVKSEFSKLSGREWGLVAAGVATLLFIAVYLVGEWVVGSLGAQAARMQRLEDSMTSLPARLDTYGRLKARREGIENQFRAVEIKEGALSYLENLIRNKAGVASGFTIRDLSARPFGGDFEQVPYSVKFTSSNLTTMIEFLKELIHGKQPFIVSKLDLQMNRTLDSLEVDLDVSTIHRNAGEK